LIDLTISARPIVEEIDGVGVDVTYKAEDMFFV